MQQTDTPSLEQRARLAENILLGCKTGEGPFAYHEEDAIDAALDALQGNFDAVKHTIDLLRDED